jgi:hypothetical protein
LENGARFKEQRDWIAGRAASLKGEVLRSGRGRKSPAQMHRRARPDLTCTRPPVPGCIEESNICSAGAAGTVTTTGLREVNIGCGGVRRMDKDDVQRQNDVQNLNDVPELERRSEPERRPLIVLPSP